MKQSSNADDGDSLPTVRNLNNTEDGTLADYRVMFECGMRCSCSVR
jgi:hypothetical protein